MKRFTGPNFREFEPNEVSAGKLHGALASSAFTTIKERRLYPGTYFIMSYVRLSSCIRGSHEYQAIWEPSYGEELDCYREISNTSEPYAVSVKKGRKAVDHTCTSQKFQDVCQTKSAV